MNPMHAVIPTIHLLVFGAYQLLVFGAYQQDQKLTNQNPISGTMRPRATKTHHTIILTS